MYRALKRACHRAVGAFGYKIVSSKREEWPTDFDEEFAELYRQVAPYTMTTKERVFAIRSSVEYLVKHDIPGDIVECGVWKGGSMMAVAQTLLKLEAHRDLYLFDTYEGMPAPGERDTSSAGIPAEVFLRTEDKASSWVWAYSPLDEVVANLRRTGYDESRMHFVKGDVTQTLPAHAPQEIALLRLDTDWYESTLHELRQLYPRLSVGGVLIIDDYGEWAGARTATDQYLTEQNLKLLLNRIDHTGRLGVKIEV